MQIRTRTSFAVLAPLVLCAGCALTAKPSAPNPATSAQAGDTTIVAIASPSPPTTTLPEFLGITGIFKGLGGLFDGIRNHLGKSFPGLEAKPSVSAITDPANMESDVPAVSSAAKIKAEEDASAQKVKAIRYLGTIGCGGCYPGVEEAMLSSLDDCTEEVRYEAVKALRETAGTPCRYCRNDACCSPAILEKLDQLANDLDDSGCYREPSARVRRIARLAMQACGGGVAAPTLPNEGPSEEDLPSSTPEGPNAQAGAGLSPFEPRYIGGSTKAFPPSKARNDVAQASYAKFNRLSTLTSRLPPIGFPHKPGHANARTNRLPWEGVPNDQRRNLTTNPPAVRWERISASFDRFSSPSQAAAVLELLRMRAMGAAFDLPARLNSRNVGSQMFGWTNPTQVETQVLSTALLNTPVGSVSQVFEDASGFHIIRVLERNQGIILSRRARADKIRVVGESSQQY